MKTEKLLINFSFFRRSLLFLFLVLEATAAFAQDAQITLHADQVYAEGRDVCQDIYLTSFKEGKATVRVALHKIGNPSDSLLLYRLTFKDLLIEDRAQRLKLSFKSADGNDDFVYPVFGRVMQKSRYL